MVETAAHNTTWETLFEESAVVIREALGSSRVTADLIRRSRLASATISAYTRHQATESSQRRTRVIEAKLVFAHPDEFRRYLGVHLPELETGEVPTEAEGG